MTGSVDNGVSPLSAQTRERLTADAREIIARYPAARSALLPMLHLVQSEQGYVSPEGIAFCAEQLDLTEAEVSAVATFYTQYKRRPNGTYTIGVCTNTLCAIMGGDAIFAALSEHLGIGHDETTEDGAITLEAVECNAGCDYAPVVMANWEFFDNQTPESALALADRLRSGADAAPTRGAAKVCTFKEISRVLAGFPDGRAGEGVNAGGPSREGVDLARRRNWTAPSPDGATAPATAPQQPAATQEKVAAEATASGAASSSHDSPPVPASTAERGGTVAGKSPAEATHGPDDDGSATTPPTTPTKEG